MYKITIPCRLYDILNSDREWYAKTQMVIERIEKYMNSSELYFFPEYTNHNLLHIQNVLNLIDKLITNETYSKLSAKDVAVLILGVYVHDIGMFLKVDGLKVLLSEQIWGERFHNFIKVASRMSDIELKKIYGDTQLFMHPTDLNKRLELSQRDKLTYGEFLRRNHADIAEVIVQNGMPGEINVDLLPEFDSEQKKIIGLLAKSHCMPLRIAAEESNSNLMGKRNSYKPSNVPIVYLMALLRMGDILDMGKDRAPHIISDLQEFSSMLSKEEWEWNQTIDSSNFNWDTAKTLYIQSEPKNTSQFVRIEKNLKWFQSELDFSWAALCDCYGNEYNLTIHRIESNIFEQPELFRNQFLTKEAKIKITSNLSKLLVDPLYQGKPFYAVRELLQNAVDACNLRNRMEIANGNDSYVGKIQIDIDTRRKFFTIEDDGIGMNEDVIVNYYLTVGASFQESDYWKKASLNDDENKKSVVRVGRFGVGFLATFLLGSKIIVTTRHLDDDKGYRFTVTMDDETISAERVENIGIGTKIQVIMDRDIEPFWKESVFQKRLYNYWGYQRHLEWNEWCHYMNPQINYSVDGISIKQGLKYNVPSNEKDSNGWFNIPSDDFKMVSYSFVSVPVNADRIKTVLGEISLLSTVIVNGFMINDTITYKTIWGVPNQAVICSIIDDKNRLGLNLSRTEIEYEHKIFSQINLEVWKWQLAKLLCCDIPAVRMKGKNKKTRQRLSKFDMKDKCPDGLFLKHDSFSFLHPYFIDKLFLDKFYILKKPLGDENCDKHIQSNIVNSELPLLIYKGAEFRSTFEKKYGRVISKCDYLFDLVEIGEIKVPYKDLFIEFVNDIFSDVEDLWIPYNMEERKEKFKKAFHTLSKYIER